MSISEVNKDTSAILDISIKDFDGFRFVFGGRGLDLSNGGSTVLIEGQAGIGKTVLALQMATAYLNREKCDKSKEYVHYIAFEQPASSLQALLDHFDFFGFRGKTEICICRSEDPDHKLDAGKLHIASRSRSDRTLSTFIDQITWEVTTNKGCSLLVLDSIGVFEGSEAPQGRGELDRLCDRARSGGFALVMVREKEPEAVKNVPEYITDTVFELQFKPMNPDLPYGPSVRTMEIKKSRVQKSHRGPHEFEIIDKRGIAVYPSCASVFQDVAESRRSSGGKAGGTTTKEKVIPVFDCIGADVVHRQLAQADGMTGAAGLRPSQSLLLFGQPGSLKTVLGLHFLRPALQHDNEDFLFLTFKIDERPLEAIARSYLKDKDCGGEYGRWKRNLQFIDARETFWTPARVLAEVRTKLPANESKNETGKELKRAVVFGMGMIDRLPAFQGMELTFLQVLTSYFESQGINAAFIEWPQQTTTPQLRFDSIVNYFATVIEWPRIEPGGRPTGPQGGPAVTRHNYRVVSKIKPLRITEIPPEEPGGVYKLKIEEANDKEATTAEEG